MKKSSSGTNSNIIEIAALTHDLIDEKLFPDTRKEELALKKVFNTLISKFATEKILTIIKSISFKENLA